jgi:hypothetical protein
MYFGGKNQKIKKIELKVLVLGAPKSRAVYKFSEESMNY